MLAGIMHPQPHKENNKADKLAETKRRKKEVHEALKQQKAEAKEKAHLDKFAEHQVAKFERAYIVATDPDHASKRAIKEAKEAEKREQRHGAESADMVCEHGVHKCRICFPHKKHK